MFLKINLEKNEMSLLISQSTIATLPVHDADFVSISIFFSDDGKMSLTITVEIDPEEFLDPLLAIGVEGREVTFHFEKCWQVTSNILSYQSRREQIVDWKTSSESERIKFLRERCIPQTVPLIHHEFEFSGGSTLEIVAEMVSVKT